jgi:hypothetical protein
MEALCSSETLARSRNATWLTYPENHRLFPTGLCYSLSSLYGRAVAQAVSRRLLTA